MLAVERAEWFAARYRLALDADREGERLAARDSKMLGRLFSCPMITFLSVCQPSEIEIMFCSQCGAPNDDRAVFCTKCGRPTTQSPGPTHGVCEAGTETAAAQQERRGKGLKTIAALAVVGYVVLVVALYENLRVAIERDALYEASDHYNQGVQHEKAGQKDLAEQQFKLALKQFPDLAEAHSNLGAIYLGRGWLDRAETETRKAIEILERTHQTSVESETLEQSMAIEYYNLGAIEVGRADETTDTNQRRPHRNAAIVFFQKAIELDPSDAQALAEIRRCRAEAYYNEGFQHMEAGQKDLAEQQFKLALQQFPDLAEAHSNLGAIYQERGWLDGAETETTKAIEILERTHQTFVEGQTLEQSMSADYNNLGSIESGRADETNDASQQRLHRKAATVFFQKAIELDPSDAQALANIRRFGTEP
jgi:tetratricopeptide (TPR) repeat protein